MAENIINLFKTVLWRSSSGIFFQKNKLKMLRLDKEYYKNKLALSIRELKVAYT